MARLSRPIADIEDHYDVVVVGSGYGGGVAASRLARAGRRVCLLERGEEIEPGNYPDGLIEAGRELQVDSEAGHLGSRTGLYDLRLNDDINVFVGCGLGGTSLVNANVSLRPDKRVFEDPCWPDAVRRDLGATMDEAFARAAEMLKPVSYPEGAPHLPKLAALRHIAAAADDGHPGPEGLFSRPPINVTFAAGTNHVGIEQQACTGCGDCVSGCNYGAKNTVLMNYLPDARNHGAEIFTRAAVRRVEKQNGRWLVHYQLLQIGREKFDAPTMSVSADLVVLAAGTLGSTEILLRSKARGLPLSERLGDGFTGNGDVLAFAYNCDRQIRGIGFGRREPQDMADAGPCISGLLDLRGAGGLEDGMVIEEGSLPGALTPILAGAFAAGSKLIGEDMDSGLGDFAAEQAREVASILGGAYRGAIDSSLTYLVMSHDDGAGRMVLEEDRLRIVWPDVGGQTVFEKIEQRLKEATKALGGTYMPNPLWTDLLGQRLVTVHPLGGCAMAEQAEAGVVDGQGRVFAGPAGREVHDGLYVFDGSIMPRSLGVNPLFTITAMAERGMAHIAREQGWRIDYALPSTAPAAPPRKLGIQFTETMRGHFSTEAMESYQTAFAEGRASGRDFAFTLTVSSDDLEEMLREETHQARMLGSVTAPSLSPDPITATDGIFNLFVHVPGAPGERRMEYRMRLTTTAGKVYGFEGFKRIRDDFGPDIWADTTTLYITLLDGEGDTAPVVGRGILKIRPDDFVRQLTTLDVLNADSALERAGAVARFGRFFAGTLFDVYGPGAA